MHITVAHILLAKAAHKVLSKCKREGEKVFPQRGVLKEVKPQFWGTRNTIYHTLQWLPIVLRIKSKILTWPRRLPLMLSQLNSPNLPLPFLSIFLWTLTTLSFHFLNMPLHPLFSGSLNMLIPLFFCLSSFPHFILLFLHVSAQSLLPQRNLPWNSRLGQVPLPYACI